MISKSLIAIMALSLLFVSSCKSCLSSSSDTSDKTNIGSYVVVGTAQNNCFNNATKITCPEKGKAFYGQDAQDNSKKPSYTNNNNGTVSDKVTGLMWRQNPGKKVTYSEAESGAKDFELAGYSDWRLPTIKELYSLMNFNGMDPRVEDTDSSGLTPFINTDYFSFKYGDPSVGDRIIDSQWATSAVYNSTVMDGKKCFFGVNFADGRIKCYPIGDNTYRKKYYVVYVRGPSSYGNNNFKANGNGTITDKATGLIWMQNDSGKGLDWKDALAYCEDIEYAGFDNWRLPNAKEIQGIVDYNRSPDKTNSPAINPLFNTTSITNEAGKKDYPFFWASTTHKAWNGTGKRAVYVAFGRAMGNMHGQWMDVHGAGAQRSDPKIGNPADYPNGHGPQGDAVRIYNYVRCVRDAQ